MIIWLRTCVLGIGGGWLAHSAGFPSDWLLGAMLVVALAAIMGLAVSLPKSLLAPIQACLGVAVGLRLEFDLPAPSSLLLSVAGLLLCLGTQIPLGQFLLRRLGWSAEEAVMGASPGALSIMAALATSLDNPIRVILSQTVRVIALVSSVSVIMLLEWVPALPMPAVQALNLSQTLGLVLTACVLGKAGAWLKIPASYILTGVAVAAIYSAWSDITAVPVAGLMPISMALLGALVGSRLKPLPIKETVQLLLVGLLISISSSVISLIWAVIVGLWLQLPVFQVWLAYAPGAVEAMIYLALVTGLDPSLVIFHHVLRILLLGLCAGWLMRRAQLAAT